MSAPDRPVAESVEGQPDAGAVDAALTLPTAALAERILAKCSYADRLPAGRLSARVGIMRGTVRGLPELHLYLMPDDRSLPAVSLARLADWMERVVADAELAAATRAATSAAGSYVDACIATHALVGERLAQARSVLGPLATGAVGRTGARS